MALVVDMKAANAMLSELRAATQTARTELAKLPTASDQQPNLEKCKALLAKIKDGMVDDFASTEASSEQPDRLLVCRGVLECAVFIAAMGRDPQAFERSIKRLKTTFYRDYSQELPESEYEGEVMGLFLLYLLSANRLGEFHTVVEQLNAQLRSSECVRYSLDLEVCLMDGNYNEVVKAAARVPKPIFASFMPQLVETARLKVAQCLEVSYNSVSTEHARKLLMLEADGGAALQRFATQMNDSNAARRDTERGLRGSVVEVGSYDDDEGRFVTWEVVGDKLLFSSTSVKPSDHTEKGPDIPALELIQNVIEYATELERIV